MHFIKNIGKEENSLKYQKPLRNVFRIISRLRCKLIYELKTSQLKKYFAYKGISFFCHDLVLRQMLLKLHNLCNCLTKASHNA